MAGKYKDPDYMAKWRAAHVEEIRQYSLAYAEKRTGWIEELKAERGCDRCGESCPRCLEFHHRNPAEKVVTIAKARASNWAKDRIEAEIEKCDLLCANCHRKQHYPECK